MLSFWSNYIIDVTVIKLMVQLLCVNNSLRRALPLDVAIVMYTKQLIDFGVHWTTLDLQPGSTNTHLKKMV